MASQIECEEAIRKLLYYLDGELGEPDRLRVARHLETCRACYSRAEFERRLRSLVAEAGEVPAPASLRSRVRGLMERF